MQGRANHWSLAGVVAGSLCVALVAADVGIADRVDRAKAKRDKGRDDAVLAYWRARVAADRDYAADMAAVAKAAGGTGREAALAKFAADAVQQDMTDLKAKTPVMTLDQARALLPPSPPAATAGASISKGMTLAEAEATADAIDKRRRHKAELVASNDSGTDHYDLWYEEGATVKRYALYVKANVVTGFSVNVEHNDPVDPRSGSGAPAVIRR